MIVATEGTRSPGCMAQIFTGQVGGLPWSILGTTFEVAGVVRTELEIDDDEINSGFRPRASAKLAARKPQEPRHRR